MTFDPPLYLASRSPRRRELLRDAGFAPVVVDSGFDDSHLAPPPGTPPAAWVQELALMKARAALERLRAQGIEAGTILAADTVCVIDGRIEGQPRNRDDARRMLHAMRDREHITLTGVAILPLKGGLPAVFCDHARVVVGELTEEMIEGYLDSGDWQGKAGAYNLIERQQAGWPVACPDDPATVMGLPMRRLSGMLRRET